MTLSLKKRYDIIHLRITVTLISFSKINSAEPLKKVTKILLFQFERAKKIYEDISNNRTCDIGNDSDVLRYRNARKSNCSIISEAVRQNNVSFLEAVFDEGKVEQLMNNCLIY